MEKPPSHLQSKPLSWHKIRWSKKESRASSH